MTTVIRINLLYCTNSSNNSRARRHTVQNASKQHIHSKCYILSLKSKDLETFKVKNDHRSKFSNLSNWKEEA